jgi:transcriptional regulator with XRE-family HTH domain
LKLAIGQKIRALRLTSELTQEELAVRSGVSKGFISQLENEQTSVQIDTLSDILEALGQNLGRFFTDPAPERPVYKPSERVSIENTGAVSFEILVPGSTNNMMDPAMVTLDPGESLEKRGPHSGEQFGYVLKGVVTLRLGKHSYKVRSKGCFYFESNREYQILNDNSKPAILLWVVSPPQM